MIKKRPLKFKHFAQTLLLIIEDGAKTSFTEGVCCLLILVLFCQIAGYIFNNFESKPLYENNIKYFAHWMEYATGTFLLFITAKDTLTLFFFGVFQFILYSYLSYIIAMTLLRRWFPRTLQKIKTFRDSVNVFLRMFFSLFLWIFYIPFTEMHAGVAVCGNNSFLLEYRNSVSCGNKPAYQTLLGWVGVVLTFFTGCLLNYVFVNYDFRDKNLLKRRFRPNIIIQILFRTLLISLYYLDISNVILIKHFCSHVIGILICYDYIRFFPFKNKTVSIFYGSCCFIFEGTMSIFSLWELTDYYSEYNLFHMWIFMIPMGFAMAVNVWNRKYESFMTISLDIRNNEKLQFLDHYLEELHHMAEVSQVSKTSKLRLMGTLENHIRSCKSPVCLLKKEFPMGHYLDTNFQIEKEKVIQIINNFFTMGLSNDYFKINAGEREFISLKFYTFLSNFQDNPVRAYYELKSMLHREKKKENSNSLLFKLLSKIISRNIEMLIIQYLEQSGGGPSSTRTFSIRSEYLNSISLYKFLNFKTEFVAKFREVAKKKIEFWENLQKGFESLEIVLRHLINLISGIIELREEYLGRCREFDNGVADKENIIYLKMLSTFNLVVLNDVIATAKIENKIFDIKKRDSVTAKENLTSLSIIKGDSVVLIASMLEETGKIISLKNENQARLFGYNKNDFSIVTHVNDLMPPSMSEVHNSIIRNYISTGKSILIRNSRVVQAIDKGKFMFPVKLFLNYVFDYSTDFALAATLTRLDTSTVNILCDRHGNIDGISRNFYDALGLNPDRIHPIILSKCNILLLIPKLFERINLKELEKNISEKDHYVDLLVNERMEIIIPADFKTFCEGFNKDPSVKSLKSKWKNKKFLKTIENYLGDADRELRLSRKCIILSLKCRYITIKENDRRTFYYVEITEIYSENNTSTYLTHNTFAVTMSRNDSSRDEFVQMNSLVKSGKSREVREERNQISLIPVKEEDNTESEAKKVNLLIHGPQEKTDSSRLEPPPSSKNSGGQTTRKDDDPRRDDDPPYVNTEQLEESMLIAQDVPLESRRNPIKPVEFNKPEFKEEDSFDPRHEESLPMFDRPTPQGNAPSFMKDEDSFKKESVTKEIKGEPLGNSLENRISEEDAEDSSSHHDSDKMDKNKDLLKSLNRSRTNKSDAFTKKINEDDERAFQRSIHSSSSMRTTYGSAFIKDILNNFKYPRLLSKIKIIALVEITCFLVTNIMYLILIQNRLSNFKDQTEKMTFSASLTQAYTRQLADQNFKFINSQGLVGNLTDYDLTIMNKIGDHSYDVLKDFLYFKQDVDFYQQYKGNTQKVYRFQDGHTRIEELKEYDFYDLALKSMYEFNLIPLEKEVQTVNIDEYLFWRANFLDTTLTSEFLIIKYLSIGDSDRDAVVSFYLIISIVGLSVAILLQLVNLPFLNEFFRYVQKLILLITRITQDECRLEINNLKKYERMLASARDDFLTEDFLNDEQEGIKRMEKSSKANDLSKSKRATSNYLSSKIGIHKVRTLPKYFLIALLILIVTFYFMGLIIYLTTIQKQLNFSVDISRAFTTFWRNMDNTLCEFNILLSTPFLKEKDYLPNNDFDQLFKHFKGEVQNLNSFRKNLIVLNQMPEVPGNYRDELDKLLNDNLCDTYAFAYCDDTHDKVFKAGILGLISYMVSESQEAIDLLVDPAKMTVDHAKYFFNGTKIHDRIIATYSFRFLRDEMMKLLKGIHSEGVDIIKNTLIIIFAIGGIGSSLVLMSFLIYLFKNLKRDLIFMRMSLLLIPNKKLSEDTVIYLLKNIETI